MAERNNAWIVCSLRGKQQRCENQRPVAYLGNHTRAHLSEEAGIVRKHTLKRTTGLTQRTQSVMNVYFGGYFGKRQPGGSLEIRKRMKNLHTLRDENRGKGKAAQLRGASGRLITDIEMNSTYRGAVEVFNLARNLNERDVLFAKSIRTLKEHTVDGRAWLYRLESLQPAKNPQSECLQTFVPPTKKAECAMRSVKSQ